MVKRRPFSSLPGLLEMAERELDRLAPEDWLECFAHHPRIGDLEGLQRKYGTSGLAAGEQAAAQGAPQAILAALAQANRAYEQRFGYIFIVCATGKSAAEMLALLRGRIDNDPGRELAIAAGEQRKITRLRLEKLFR